MLIVNTGGFEIGLRYEFSNRSFIEQGMNSLIALVIALPYDGVNGFIFKKFWNFVIRDNSRFGFDRRPCFRSGYGGQGRYTIYL